MKMFHPFFHVLLMALEVITTFATVNAQDEANSLLPNDPIFRPSDDYYQRYTHYPEYCSTPQHMDQRRIPQLQDTQDPIIGKTRLVHVTASIRHGARTPWSSKMKCWEGYWNDVRTGVWDCNLSTFMAQPDQDENGDPRAMFLFEKRYDALPFRQDRLANELNGTCQMGQLLYQGHEQELQNGKILRDAYAFRKGEEDQDERMRLIDLSLQDYFPWQPEHLYFRADDDQRTVMSGQVLLRGLFDPELAQAFREKNQYPAISLHIADRDRDIVDANDHDCPRLDQILAKAALSSAYQEFDHSQASQDVRKYMADKLEMGNETRNSILDCLMCTVCTDRLLPDAVNDFDGTTDNWFTRMAEYDIQTYTKLMKYNNSQYAKLALGPLWYEIMQNIRPFLEASPHGQDGIRAPRFALFSGHDTTIMPLLASLGPQLWNDTDWPPYASMMVIEIHELIDELSDSTVFTSNFAFRLVYNGRVLTPLVEGCAVSSDLCDIVHFLSLVDPIATRRTNCATPPVDLESSTLESVSLSSPLGVAFFVILVFSSGFCGMMSTYCVTKKLLMKNSGRRKVDYNGAWTIEEDDDNDEYGLEMREGDFEDEPARMEESTGDRSIGVS